MGNRAKFVVVGVNFRNTSLEVRSRFALTADSIRKMYENTPSHVLNSYFVLSTCNRTEIYALTNQPELLLRLFSLLKGITYNEVRQYSFIKKGDDAIKHLFRVASGLDSQILGDHEIIGQLKNAFTLAKSYKKTSGFMEKLYNSSLQVSKQVKGRTSISNGTTSVSYSVIQLLKQTGEQKPLHVCLLGLGKIGTLTLKNIKHYMPQHRVTLINRDAAKAMEAATEHSVNYASFGEKAEILKGADVLIVATGADEPVICKGNLEGTPVKLVFDLSVPSNVSTDVREISRLTLYNIDELSHLVNQTIAQRKAEIPVAETIIEEHFAGLKEWEERRELYAAKAA